MHGPTRLFRAARCVTAATMDRSLSPLPVIALLAGSSALALGPWLVRLVAVGPVAAGFWRVALGAVMLAFIARGLGQSLARPPRLTWVIALASFFFAADLALWHQGILLTKLGNSVLFGNFGSFAFACYGLWLARTWPRPLQVVALLLAVAGTLLLLWGSIELGPATVRGDLLCLAAGLLYTGYLIGVERGRKTLEPIPLLTWASGFAALFLLPMALLSGERLMPERWDMVFQLAASSQVIGQGLLVYAIGRLPPLVVGLGLLTQPAVAGAIGWAVYGETFTLTDWTGALFIAAALVLVRLRPRPAPPT